MDWGELALTKALVPLRFLFHEVLPLAFVTPVTDCVPKLCLHREHGLQKILLVLGFLLIFLLVHTREARNWYLLRLLNTKYLDMKGRWDLSLEAMLAIKKLSVFPLHKPGMAMVKVTDFTSRQLQCPEVPDINILQECRWPFGPCIYGSCLSRFPKNIWEVFAVFCEQFCSKCRSSGYD